MSWKICAAPTGGTEAGFSSRNARSCARRRSDSGATWMGGSGDQGAAQRAGTPPADPPAHPARHPGRTRGRGLREPPALARSDRGRSRGVGLTTAHYVYVRRAHRWRRGRAGAAHAPFRRSLPSQRSCCGAARPPGMCNWYRGRNSCCAGRPRGEERRSGWKRRQAASYRSCRIEAPERSVFSVSRSPEFMRRRPGWPEDASAASRPRRRS